MNGHEITLYDLLKAAGCKIDSHESDLYVEDSETSRAIIRAHASPQQKGTLTPFRHAADGTRWLDLPFAYSPWWRKRVGRDVSQFAASVIPREFEI